ncbi:MAG: polysaccharide deacetylase family protein [Aminivibrio sp.]|jgi:undecaprenyl phosphate-alpha-L-ara4FN deformylase
MTETVLVLKVDVDTKKGYREGVPRLLEILRARKIKASFFFSFGPDNSGKAIRRIFRKGFIKKMLRTRAPSAYGVKTLLYGTLLPAPLIVEPEPGVFIRAFQEGHDCGIHCWDHVKWQDRLPVMTEEEIRADFEKAMELFEKYTSRPAKSCAAPGWQVTATSLAVQDELGFDYCSDARGEGGPFLPRMEGRAFKTLQIPTTLPTLDEVYGREDVPAGEITGYYLGLLGPGLNVHTIHAEMEGGALSGLFEQLLDGCITRGVTFRTLNDIALGEALSGRDTPLGDVAPGVLPGRAGTVAVVGGKEERE